MLYFHPITIKEYCINVKAFKLEYVNMEFSVNNWEPATIVGWIDSDGTIAIRRRGKRFYPMVALYQENFNLCKSMKLNFGGSAYQYTQNGGKHLSFWHLYKKTDVISFLTKIEPYLKHKQPQCKVILEILVINKSFKFFAKTSIAPVSAFSRIAPKNSFSR